MEDRKDNDLLSIPIVTRLKKKGKDNRNVYRSS